MVWCKNYFIDAARLRSTPDASVRATRRSTNENKPLALAGLRVDRSPCTSAGVVSSDCAANRVSNNRKTAIGDLRLGIRNDSNLECIETLALRPSPDKST